MLIYGVCISDIEKINTEKAEAFLKELAAQGHDFYLKEFEDNRKDNGENNYEEYTVSSYLYDYESDNSYCGLSAFLCDVISDVEGVDIKCDDPNGVHYLGLDADAPWAFNKKTRNMSAEKYRNILKKYISKVTDDKLEIRWWNVCEDCDY